MSQDISISRSKNLRPKPPASDLGFGRFFTDHMFLADYDGTGWTNARVVPYGPLPLDPAAAALHYGQTLFEGMKAYRSKKERPLVFRPELHAARLNASAQRLCMPSLPEADFLAALRTFLDIDVGFSRRAASASVHLLHHRLPSGELLGSQTLGSPTLGGNRGCPGGEGRRWGGQDRSQLRRQPVNRGAR